MSYLGDFALGSTFDTKFCTVTNTGAPTQLAGTPVVSAYPDNSTTQLTAGITLTVDFDTVTGLNNVRVVATSGNGYATATNYQLVITTGTVGGVSVVGYVIAEFSIENRSGLRPTTAGRTLDVSSTGEAGVDWANVGSPTTSVGLTNTTIATTQKVDLETIKTQTVATTGAGTITVPAAATLASTTNITAGTITTATNLTNAPTSGDLTATMKTSVTTACTASTPTAAAVTAAVTVGTNNDKTGYGLSAAAVQAIWDALTAALTTAGSIGKLLVDNINATISSRSTVTTAQVNAEVVDALATDTYAEPAQGTPAATTTLAAKINYLYKAWRNRNTQTATQYSLYNDDALTVDHKATFSDDGTTADRGEIATGP